MATQPKRRSDERIRRDFMRTKTYQAGIAKAYEDGLHQGQLNAARYLEREIAKWLVVDDYPAKERVVEEFGYLPNRFVDIYVKILREMAADMAMGQPN